MYLIFVYDCVHWLRNACAPTNKACPRHSRYTLNDQIEKHSSHPMSCQNDRLDECLNSLLNSRGCPDLATSLIDLTFQANSHSKHSPSFEGRHFHCILIACITNLQCLYERYQRLHYKHCTTYSQTNL